MMIFLYPYIYTYKSIVCFSFFKSELYLTMLLCCNINAAVILMIALCFKNDVDHQLQIVL